MPAAIKEFVGATSEIVLADIVDRAQPLVIRNLCSHWPMVAWSRQSDTAFAKGLAAHDNGTEVDALLMSPDQGGVIGYNANFDGFNYAHHRVSITQVLQRLAHFSRQDDAPGLAMQSALIATCMPGLLADHDLPFLASEVSPRIWIGNRVTTPAHFDEYHNVACVVSGARRFTLFAPEQVGNLYVGPLDFAPTGAAISMARLDQPDDRRFPRLKDALAEAWHADLQPGDAIYIPPMWWHHVASLQRINALVNYWWKPQPADGHAPTTALGCLMHCILAFKSLGAAERAAWKVLLEHYVFTDEDPALHIPAGRRGVLGPLSPAQLVELRETIKRYL